MDQTLTIEEKVRLAQATKERLDIIDRYDKGREGTDIDPWEDPAFEVYHVTDRYGFIHDEVLPKQPDGADAKAKSVENDRIQKWVKMFRNWKSYFPSEKITRRIYKGIPEAVRGEVWCLLLDVPVLKKANPDLYEEMKEVALKWCPLADIRQIDLDVNRTYRDHIMFRKRYDVKQQALFHVLAAYSVYNTDVGYCQGMSQIAALMLMYMNEEDAFWALTALLNKPKHNMHGFFIPGFPKLLRFQEHHDRILKKFLPKIRKYLEKNDIYSGLYTIKWFLQCFLDRVPFHLTLRLWDVYMLEGERVLVAMSYNYIKIHRRKIMRMSMEELSEFFQGSLVAGFGLEDDRVIELLREVMDDLRRVRMDVPPHGDDPLENPTRPLGVFVPPTFEQLVSSAMDSSEGGDKQEEEEEDASAVESDNRRRGGAAAASHRPNIPADGGPVVLPSPLAKRLSRMSSGLFSQSNDDDVNNDDANNDDVNNDDVNTDGASSHAASGAEYQSSRTSMVDSLPDAGCLNTSGSSEVVAGAASGGERSDRCPQPVRSNPGDAESERKTESAFRWSDFPEVVDYETILANSRLQKQDVERTLENLADAEGTGRTKRLTGLRVDTTLSPAVDSLATPRNSRLDSVSSSLVQSPNTAQFRNPTAEPGRLTALPTPTELRELDDLLNDLGIDPHGHSDLGKRSPLRPSASCEDDEVIVIPIEHVPKDAMKTRYSVNSSRKSSLVSSSTALLKSSSPSSSASSSSGVFTPIPVLHLRSVPVVHLRGGASSPVTPVANGSFPNNPSSSFNSSGLSSKPPPSSVSAVVSPPSNHSSSSSSALPDSAPTLSLAAIRLRRPQRSMLVSKDPLK